MRTRYLLFGAIALFLVTAASIGSAQQRRRLGPNDRVTILDARLDPSFTSTPVNRLALLPFGNELDYPDGSMLLSENFLGAMRQKHPEMTILGPQETRQLITDQKLTDSYRAFSGNYVNTGVPTVSFLQALGRSGRVDGILIGKIFSFGISTQPYSLNTALGVISWSTRSAVVGMEVKLLRSTDGRELWWGTHAIEGQKNETVRDLSQQVGDVIATYFGRLAY